MSSVNAFNGEKLQRFREERGLSMEMLAKKAKITPKYLYNIETSRQRPSPELMEAFARIFRISTNDLCGVDDFYDDVDSYTQIFETINKVNDPRLKPGACSSC